MSYDSFRTVLIAAHGCASWGLEKLDRALESPNAYGVLKIGFVIATIIGIIGGTAHSPGALWSGITVDALVVGASVRKYCNDREKVKNDPEKPLGEACYPYARERPKPDDAPPPYC